MAYERLAKAVKKWTQNMELQLEEDSQRDFFRLIDVSETDQTYFDSAVEKMDEITFDSFTYMSIVQRNSF